MVIALATLPITLFIAYAIKVPLGMAMAKEGRGYDNKDPRAQQARLEGWGRRANSAHLNAFEAFPPFAAGVMLCSGVMLCYVTHTNPMWTTALAVTHAAARLVYPMLYIAGIDKLRSLVWMAGFVASFGLLVMPLFHAL
jgi:uncharacterized MAPEG superfamily protein